MASCPPECTGRLGPTLLPEALQGPWVGNNLYATSLVTNNIWYGGQIRNDKGDFVVRNFTGKPRVIRANPLTIQFQYKNTAVWSDGRPVTCAGLSERRRRRSRPASSLRMRSRSPASRRCPSRYPPRRMPQMTSSR